MLVSKAGARLYTRPYAVNGYEKQCENKDFVSLSSRIIGKMPLFPENSSSPLSNNNSPFVLSYTSTI
jgi:hypothetical protein